MCINWTIYRHLVPQRLLTAVGLDFDLNILSESDIHEILDDQGYSEWRAEYFVQFQKDVLVVADILALMMGTL